MQPGGSSDELDESRDMLANVDVNNRTVPCIRFMGGREYAEICRHFGASAEDDVTMDDVAAVIANGAAVLAPVDPSLLDPEVTPAFVRLADRRRDGRAS